MSKAPKKKTPNGAKPKTPSAFSAYTIKGIDRALYERFGARAKSEGHTVAWLFHRMVRDYAEGR